MWMESGGKRSGCSLVDLYIFVSFVYFPNLFPNIICKKLRENNENESGDVDVEWWQGEWLLSGGSPSYGRNERTAKATPR